MNDAEVKRLAAAATIALEQTIAGCRNDDEVEVQRARDVLHGVADNATPNILAAMLAPLVNMGELLIRQRRKSL